MFNRRIAVILCLFVAALFVATTASAQERSSQIDRQFHNNTGTEQTDLHIYFNGPVDAATGVHGSNPPFADKTNSGTNVIVLSNGSVPAGGSTGCIEFTSSADGLKIDSAYWTPSNIWLVPSEIAPCAYPTPTLTEYGLLALALLVVISAVWIIWKRRKATVAA
jgi:hypothetical protein